MTVVFTVCAVVTRSVHVKNLCYRDVDSVVIQRINQCSNGKMSVFVDSVLTRLVCVCVCVFSQSKNICSFFFH